jgi:carboxyl-terminal processing protease
VKRHLGPPRRRATPILASLYLTLALLLSACTFPGTPITPTPAATATIASTPTTIAAANTATPAATARGTAAATPATPTGGATRTVATPTRGAATPAANATPTRGTPSPARGAATPTAGRGTPGATTAARESFTATKDEPCRDADLEQAPLPERAATVETVEQAYRCLLLHYVDRKTTLDHQVLLNGAWDIFRQAGLPAADTAPLALTGDKEADWLVYQGRYNTLVQKYGRAIDTSLLARVAIDGMARSLNDNHVAFLDPKLWRRFQLELSGENKEIGPGFNLAIDEANGTFYLYEVYPNTPAATAGLRAGDIIEQVGGSPASRGAPNQALYDLLTGPVGTRSSLRLTRPSTGATINAQVSIVEFSVPTIESRVIDGTVGYVKLRAFSIDAGTLFDQEIAKLQAQGITSIIFDVRQNGGGSTAALARILSYFSHQGPHAITIDEDGNREEENPDPNVPLLNIPWVVLCNNGSASSSDITAAFAKARGGRLIGEKSSGSLGAALVFELEEGSALEITVARVLGPNGEEINEIGVTPDEIVPLTAADLSAGNDPQLAAGLAHLRTR